MESPFNTTRALLSAPRTVRSTGWEGRGVGLVQGESEGGARESAGDAPAGD